MNVFKFVNEIDTQLVEVVLKFGNIIMTEKTKYLVVGGRYSNRYLLNMEDSTPLLALDNNLELFKAPVKVEIGKPLGVYYDNTPVVKVYTNDEIDIDVKLKG